MRKLKLILLLVLLMCSLGILGFQHPIQSNAQTTTSSTQVCGAAERLVCFYVVVTDTFHRPVGPFERKYFSVWEGKTEQPIAFFSQGPTPASIAVLFDVSRLTPMEALKTAAQSVFLLRRESHTANEYLIATFSDRDDLLANWTNEDSLINSALEKLSATRPKGDSALFDSLYLNIGRLSSARHQRRVLILFSDGFDKSSRQQGFKEVRALLERSDITLYVIGNGLSSNGSPHVMHAQDQISELAANSGGQAYFPSVDEIFHAFGLVTTDLRFQYTLGIKPDETRDNKWHPLKVLIEHPDLKSRKSSLVIRARRGYWN
jgi:VWFA-related protein